MRLVNIVFLFLAAAVALVASRPTSKNKRWVLPQHGFLHFLRYFYFTTNWDEANSICKQYSGQLATAETPERRDVILDFLKKKGVTNELWIGLQRADARSPFVWTGGGQEMLQDDGKLIWQEPPPLTPDKLCVHVNPQDDYRWQASDCQQAKKPSFLCQIEVPDYARGPNGCITDKVPTLSATYLASHDGPGVVQLISDCGLEGPKTLYCKGPEDQAEIIRRMTCGKWNLTGWEPLGGTSTRYWGSSGTRHKRDSTSTATYTESPSDAGETTTSTDGIATRQSVSPQKTPTTEQKQSPVATEAATQKVPITYKTTIASSVTVRVDLPKLPAAETKTPEVWIHEEVTHPIPRIEELGEVLSNIAPKKAPPQDVTGFTTTGQLIAQGTTQTQTTPIDPATIPPITIKSPTSTEIGATSEEVTIPPTLPQTEEPSTEPSTAATEKPEIKSPEPTTSKTLSHLPHPPLMQGHSKHVVPSLPTLPPSETSTVITTSTDVPNEIADNESIELAEQAAAFPNNLRKAFEDKEIAVVVAKDDKTSDEVQERIDEKPVVLIEEKVENFEEGSLRQVSQVVIERKDDKVMATTQIVEEKGDSGKEEINVNYDGGKPSIELTGPQIETILIAEKPENDRNDEIVRESTEPPSQAVQKVTNEPTTDEPGVTYIITEKQPQELVKETELPTEKITETQTENVPSQQRTTPSPITTETQNPTTPEPIRELSTPDPREIEKRPANDTAQILTVAEEKRTPEPATHVPESNQPDTTVTTTVVKTETSSELPTTRFEAIPPTIVVEAAIETKPVKEVTTIRLSEFYGPEPSADVADGSEYSSEEAQQAQTPVAKHGRGRGLYHPAGPLSFYPYFLSKVLG